MPGEYGRWPRSPGWAGAGLLALAGGLFSGEAAAQTPGDVAHVGFAMAVNPAGGLTHGVDVSAGVAGRIGSAPRRRKLGRAAHRPTGGRWLEGYARVAIPRAGLAAKAAYWGAVLDLDVLGDPCPEDVDPASRFDGGFGLGVGLRYYNRAAGPTDGYYLGLGASLAHGRWTHSDECPRPGTRPTWAHRAWWLGPTLELGHRWAVGERGRGLVGLGLVGGAELLVHTTYDPPASWLAGGDVDATERPARAYLLVVVDVGFRLY